MKLPLWLAATIIAFGTGLCLHQPAPAASVSAVMLAELRVQGGGASFPKAIYQRWASDFSKAHPDIHVEYTSQGSGFGIAGISNQTLDFGASDAPMSRREREAVKTGELVHIPTVAGAVVIAYNIPGVEGDLKLTGEIIADIYAGKITNWSDAKITAINPDLKLPSLPIAPIYRADASGTSFVFTNYLATQSESFLKTLPPTKQFQPPVGQAEKGNEGVSNRVRSIPGAVGYVELTYAMNEKLPSALVKNKAGNFIRASTETVSNAGEKAEKLIDPIWNSPADQAYPISAFTYVLIYKDLGYLKDQDRAKAVLSFLRFAVGEGQSSAASLYYAPLPPAMKAKADAALDAITFDGKALK